MANVNFAYGTTTPTTSTSGFNDGCIYFNTSNKIIYMRQGTTITQFKGTDNNTTYSAATQSASGLMSAADKKKLDTILTTIYPVGAIYLSTSSTSPGTLFGGTWERIQDRFLLAAGSSYSAGATGGEATHTLTVDEMPSHTHAGANVSGGERGTLKYSFTTHEYLQNGSSNTGHTATTGSSGSSIAHNNMPPYLAVYVWKRTA